MQEEIQNRNQNWKSRFHDLDSLPGEPAPAFSDAWEKLHGRLGQNKRNIKPILWFIAAACTILIIFLLTIDRAQNTKPDIVERKINHTKEIVKFDQPKKNLVEPAQPVKQIHGQIKIPAARVKFQLAIAKTDSAIQISVPPVNKLTESTDLVKSDSPSITPQRKMRVMHVNDLEPDGEQRLQQWVQGENIKTKHSNNNNLIRSYVSNNTSDKVLKIILTPSN